MGWTAKGLILPLKYNKDGGQNKIKGISWWKGILSWIAGGEQ